MPARRFFPLLLIPAILWTMLPTLPVFAAQVSADSLAGYWKFDETSGTSAADASGGGLTGTHTNGPAISSDVPSAISFPNARSLYFDDADDAVIVSDSPALDIGTSSFTVAGWVKGESMDDGDIIFGKSNGGAASSSYGFLFGVWNSLRPTVYFATSDTIAFVQGSDSISNGAWTHIAIVVNRSNSSGRVYINGVFSPTTANSLASNTAAIDNSVDFAIGSESDGGFNWSGNLDDLRLYKRILAPWEIAELAAGRHVPAYWKGKAGTGFENMRNWSGSYVPDPYSRIVVRAMTGSLTLTGAIKAAGLTINSGALVNLNGTGFTMNDSGTFTNYGTLALKNSETLTNLTVPPNKGTVMITGTGSTTGFKTGNSYYNLTLNDGLIAYYTFDGTSTLTVDDQSGYGNSGALLNAAVPSGNAAAPLNFRNPRSLSLQGSQDYMRVPYVRSMPDRTMTVCTWVKSSSSAVYMLQANRNAAGFANQWIFQISSGKANFWDYGSDYGFSEAVTAATAINDNRWHHVCFVKNLTSGTYYTDGRVDGTDTAASNITYGANDLVLGLNYRDFDQDLSGFLDDVRIYNRALKHGEVAALAAGNEPSLQLGTITLNAALDVNNTLTLNGGTLDVSSSNYGITVGGSWLNNGGTFAARKGTVTFDGTTTGLELLTGGQRFNAVTFNGSSATWNTRDRFTASGALTLTSGTLDASGSYVVRAGTVTQTAGTFMPRSGTLILTSAADATATITSTLHILRMEDATENGLVGYWKLDEGTNTGMILDSSGYGSSGVRTGTGRVWTGTTLASAISFDNPFAMKFNGSNDSVHIPQSDRFAVQHLSLSAWINLSASAGDRNAIVSYGKGSELNGASAAAESYVLIYHKSSNVLRFRLRRANDTSIIDLQATPAVALSGEWSHVAATWNGTTATLYQNGISLGTATSADTINYTSDSLTQLRIGNWFGNNERYFNGSIDDVRVYNRALSDNEVVNLARGRYAAGDSSTATATLGAHLSTAYLALDSGNLSTSSSTLTVSNTLSMLRGRGALTLGSAATTLGGLIMSGSTLTSAAGTLDINGDITFQTGSLIAPSGYLTLSGNWTKTGGYFDPNSGTMLLDGDGQALSGTGSFYNLTKSAVSPASLIFGAGQTFTILGTLMLSGVASNLLALRSSVPGSPWRLNPLGSRSLAYLDVQDSTNIHATQIDCADLGCVDRGNNTNWDFGSSANNGRDSGGGGTRGKGTTMLLAIRAREDLVRRYGQTAVREPDTASSQSSRAARVPPGMPVIERQRNRVVLIEGDTQVMYKDVLADAWYAPYVSNVIQDNVARGYRDAGGALTGEFGVGKPITKAEILKMALEAAGKNTLKASAPRNKTAQKSWAASYVGIAESLALSGFTPATDINKPATRGEVVQLILEALDITIGKTPANYSDVPKNHPHSYAIAAATFFGLVIGDTKPDGTPLNTFRPDDSINRAEASKLIAMARALKKLGAIAPPAMGGMTVPDASSSSFSSSSIVSSSASTTSSAAAQPEQNQAKVISRFLNIRIDSRITADQIGTIYHGHVVTVLRTLDNGWSHIRTSFGKEGYVRSEYLGPLEE